MPTMLYLRTGSTCVRGNVSPGLGAYRSTDAGKTWQSIGLENTGQIGKMVVHPTDSQVVWAAVLGSAFGPNEERGVACSHLRSAHPDPRIARRTLPLGEILDSASLNVLVNGIELPAVVLKGD